MFDPNYVYQNLRCGKIPNRFGIGPKTHPTHQGFININVSSMNKRSWGKLSPMVLGPVNIISKKEPSSFYPNGITPGFVDNGNDTQVGKSYCIENFWQGSKVYDIDIRGNEIQDSFFQRRSRLMNDPKPHRRALPKGKATIVCAVFNGIPMGYVTSRIFYCTMYAKKASQTPEFAALKDMFLKGTNVHLLEHDGRDVQMSYNSLMIAYMDPREIFGHGLVLCCMLLGLNIWGDYNRWRTQQLSIPISLRSSNGYIEIFDKIKIPRSRY